MFGWKHEAETLSIFDSFVSFKFLSLFLWNHCRFVRLWVEPSLLVGVVGNSVCPTLLQHLVPVRAQYPHQNRWDCLLRLYQSFLIRYGLICSLRSSHGRLVMAGSSDFTSPSSRLIGTVTTAFFFFFLSLNFPFSLSIQWVWPNWSCENPNPVWSSETPNSPAFKST